MAGETWLIPPRDRLTESDARRFWQGLPKGAPGHFRFIFVYALLPDANQLADHLRACGYLPVGVDKETPYRFRVYGHTPEVPSEQQLISLYAWFHTICTQFRATFHSIWFYPES